MGFLSVTHLSQNSEGGSMPSNYNGPRTRCLQCGNELRTREPVTKYFCPKCNRQVNAGVWHGVAIIDDPLPVPPTDVHRMIAALRQRVDQFTLEDD